MKNWFQRNATKFCFPYQVQVIAVWFKFFLFIRAFFSRAHSTALIDARELGAWRYEFNIRERVRTSIFLVWHGKVTSNLAGKMYIYRWADFFTKRTHESTRMHLTAVFLGRHFDRFFQQRIDLSWSRWNCFRRNFASAKRSSIYSLRGICKQIFLSNSNGHIVKLWLLSFTGYVWIHVKSLSNVYTANDYLSKFFFCGSNCITIFFRKSHANISIFCTKIFFLHATTTKSVRFK